MKQMIGRKDDIVRVRVETALRAALDKRADGEGLRTSDYVRRVLAEAVKSVVVKPKS